MYNLSYSISNHNKKQLLILLV